MRRGVGQRNTPKTIKTRETDALPLPISVSVLGPTIAHASRGWLRRYWQHHGCNNEKRHGRPNQMSHEHSTIETSFEARYKHPHRSLIFAVFFSCFKVRDGLHTKNGVSQTTRICQPSILDS